MSMLKPMKIIKIIIVVALIALAAFLAFSVFAYASCILTTRDSVYTVSQVVDSDKEVDAIVVLGASVKPDGTPSDILSDRLEVAADLYKAGVSKMLIVSGDGRDSHYDEPAAMKRYCESLGIPGSDIVEDTGGYDTYASIYRACFDFGIKDAVIVTQAYHLYRALAIADGLGMPSIGVAADKGKYDNQAMYSLREVIARDKDMLQTMFKVAPRER